MGLVSDETASNALGFDGKKEVEQAQKDRAKRIKLTMQAQGGETGAARGSHEFEKGVPPESEKTGAAGRGRDDQTDMGRGRE